MSEPIDIFTRKTVANDIGEAHANPHLIEMLEGMLEDAKNGFLISAAVIGATSDGQMESAWTGNIFEQPLLHVGALEALKTSILLALEAEQGDTE